MSGFKRWMRLIFASIVTILPVGCADDGSGISIPFITVARKPAVTWRIVVTRIDPITASEISAAVTQQLLHRHIANLIVTDASPADHILEVQIRSIHHVSKYRRSINVATLPPNVIDRLESKEVVWSGAHTQLAVEQSFEIAVSNPLTSSNPPYDAVAELADRIGEMLASIEPKVD